MNRSDFAAQRINQVLAAVDDRDSWPSCRSSAACPNEISRRFERCWETIARDIGSAGDTAADRAGGGGHGDLDAPLPASESVCTVARSQPAGAVRDPRSPRYGPSLSLGCGTSPESTPPSAGARLHSDISTPRPFSRPPTGGMVAIFGAMRGVGVVRSHLRMCRHDERPLHVADSLRTVRRHPARAGRSGDRLDGTAADPYASERAVVLAHSNRRTRTAVMIGISCSLGWPIAVCRCCDRS